MFRQEPAALQPDEHQRGDVGAHHQADAAERNAAGQRSAAAAQQPLVVVDVVVVDVAPAAAQLDVADVRVAAGRRRRRRRQPQRCPGPFYLAVFFLFRIE